MPVQRRIDWIDFAKGFTMCLVVIGHTLKTGVVHNAVYAIHVPVFFFLSGVTAKPFLSRNQIWSAFKRIMVPYYVFGLLSIIAYFFLGEYASSRLEVNGSMSLLHNIWALLYGSCRLGLPFNSPLWFLPCLLIMRLWFSLLIHMLDHVRIRIVLVAFFGCIFSFLYTLNDQFPLPFSFELALTLFPFFLLGNWCAPYLKKSDSNRLPKWSMIFIGTTLLTVVCILSITSPPVNYTNHSIPSAAAFYRNALLGCAGIYCVSVGLRNCTVLKYVGTKTMPILVLHKFPVVLLQTTGPLQDLLRNTDTLWGALSGGAVTVIAIATSLAAGHIIERVFPFALGEKTSIH